MTCSQSGWDCTAAGMPTGTAARMAPRVAAKIRITPTLISTPLTME